jgi:hypothetical protein
MGEHAQAAQLLIEALLLHFKLYLEVPRFFGERLRATLMVMQSLAGDARFEGRENWLGQTWDSLLESFGANIVSLCKPLGDLFLEAGFPELALEPFLLRSMVLEKTGNPEAEEARADVAQVKDRLGRRAAELERRARRKRAPCLEAAPDQAE